MATTITIKAVSQSARETAKQITGNVDAWKGFLDTASRLYRYSFPDQLLIYAQRPEATACASYDVWNNSIRRYIRKGSRGIALIDDSGASPKLRYVFDVADTVEYARLHPRPMSFYLWELEDRHVATVTTVLAETYDVPEPERGLHEMINAISQKRAAEYYDEHEDEILMLLENSGMANLDSDDAKGIFKETLASSLAYTVCKRCGFSMNGYSNESFPALPFLNTLNSLSLLGTATFILAEPVLMEIGRTVKDINRGLQAEKEGSKEHGDNRDNRDHRDNRDNIPAERGLSDTQPRDRPAAAAHTTAGGNRQVRPDVPRPSERTGDGHIQRVSIIRHIADYNARNRRGGAAAYKSDHGRAGAERPAAGQSDRPAGLGTPHEHAPPPSGGAGTPRPHWDIYNRLLIPDASLLQIQVIQAILQICLAWHTEGARTLYRVYLYQLSRRMHNIGANVLSKG